MAEREGLPPTAAPLLDRLFSEQWHRDDILGAASDAFASERH
ncbi:MAG: hypothetical protein AB7I24_15915 [Candidatus Nanopelagicales bacterium]